MNLHVVPMKAPDQGMNGYFQPLLFCVTSSRLRGYGFSLHDGVMNLDFLGAEQNFTVLEGSQPTYRLDFMDDSGNSLVDSFSGKPVIICRRSDLYKIIDFSYDISFENAKEAYEKNSVRFIPYSTIGNFGMIPVFTPDEILICDEETGRKRSVDAMVGINEKDVPAIFNPKLLC